MRRPRFYSSLLTFVLAVTYAYADDVTVSPNIAQTDLEAAKARFLTLQKPKLDPKLREQIEKLVRENPGLSAQDIAKKLVNNPALNQSETFEALQQWKRELEQKQKRQLPPGQTPTGNDEKKEASEVSNSSINPRLTQERSQPSGTGMISPQPLPNAPLPQPEKRSDGNPSSQPTETNPSPQLKRLSVNEPVTKQTEKDNQLAPNQNQTEPATSGKTSVIPNTQPGNQNNNLNSNEQPPGERVTPLATPTAPNTITPQRMNEKEFQTAVAWYEKNFGPLENSPAMKDLMLEFFKGQSGTSQSPFGKLLEGSKLPDLNLSSSQLPRGLNLRGLNLAESIPSVPSSNFAGSSINLPNIGTMSLGTTSLGSILFGVLILVIGFLVARFYWRQKLALRDAPRPLPGLGPWPVDPRSIRNRNDLTKAFEYLSVLTLGPDAQHYHHETIAAKLKALRPKDAELASKIASHYELARYTPTSYEFTPDEIAAARVALCQLAGVRS